MRYPNKTRVQVTCAACGIGREEWPGRALQSKRYFCSLTCYHSREYRIRRFWDRVDKAGDCWLWRGLIDRNGYGRIGDNYRVALAHRFAYEAAIGPIPAGLDVLHSCDNPPCVNPAHLRVGTHAENMADMVRRGRANPRGRKNRVA